MGFFVCLFVWVLLLLLLLFFCFVAFFIVGFVRLSSFSTSDVHSAWNSPFVWGSLFEVFLFGCVQC